MVHSAWASEMIEDQSQHLHMDGYPRFSTNDVDGMNDVKSAKNGNKSTYPAPKGTTSISAYPSAFRSSDIESTSTPGNTNTLNTMYNMDATRTSKKGNHHSSTAALGTAGYLRALQPGEIDSSSAPGFSKNTNDVKRLNNTDTAQKGKKSNYHAPTAAPSKSAYPCSFQSDEVYSSSISGDKNSMNSLNKTNATKNSKKGNVNSPTAAQAMTGYTGDFQSGEIDFDSTPTNTNTLTNASGISSMNNMKHGFKGKKGTHSSSTTGSEIAGYPSSFQSSDIGSITNSTSAAWEEHIDLNTNRKYFYNSITKRSTWGEPNAMVKRPPPPPRSPPPISRMAEKREQDQWFKIADHRGRKKWYNEITNMSQVARPDCLRKYK